MPAIFAMALRQILAANLRNARQQAGMSQEGLADAAAIDRTYVSALERARYAATVDVIERLAEALGVNPSTLLEANP
jgi:transcriptional regulator with XRE-family HTH domain